MARAADVTCPACGYHWSFETPQSWWHTQAMCWACAAPADRPRSEQLVLVDCEALNG